MDALDTKILGFPNKDGKEAIWTARHAVEGVQIFGGIGSGKTSGSGRTLALKYLKAGYGGLVLTAKPGEKEQWKKYCQLAGRDENDLIVIEPGGTNHFNFLEYESSLANNKATENIVHVLKTVIRASEEMANGSPDDPFWESALDMLIFNCIDLLIVANEAVSVQNLYSLVQDIPRGGAGIKEDSNTFQRISDLAKEEVKKKAEKWEKSMPIGYIKGLSRSEYIRAFNDAVPEYRLLQIVDNFFSATFKNLNEKTKSIIDFSFSSFLFKLLREPIFSLFCDKPSNVSPEQCFGGKIILINLPVKVFNKVGRDCQILFKFIWQRAMEKRLVDKDTLPVFLWADEAQNFLHEYDTDYQATARSSRIATVYITQNLPNYYANMGGTKSEPRVKSFLGTLGTKIFHANADYDTNKYASDIIGDKEIKSTSSNIPTTFEGGGSMTTSLKLEKILRPEAFGQLRTGTESSNGAVDAIIHFQSKVIDKKNYYRAIFNQEYTLPTI